MKYLTALALALLPLGCAANRNAAQSRNQVPPIEEGFLDRAVDAAPLGPIAADRRVFLRIQELSAGDSLAAPDAARELKSTLAEASQTMLAASALGLFRAGVYTGSTDLIDLACGSSRRVTHHALRRANHLGEIEAACGSLASLPSAPKSDVCGTSLRLLLDGYRQLAAGQEEAARKTEAEGLRQWSRCDRARALTRSPVPPTSRGFLVVATLQALDAAPVTYLGGEPAPDTAEAINAAFVQGAKLTR